MTTEPSEGKAGEPLGLAAERPVRPGADTRKSCTCDGAGRGPGRPCVVKDGGRLGELWRCADGLEPNGAQTLLSLRGMAAQEGPAAAKCQWCGDYTRGPCQCDAALEIARLSAALAKANEQAERFERGWYLRGDALEKLEQWADAYPLTVFPEPLRLEWQRAAALLSEKGLSLDRISASNMRHVINGVREIVAEGLKA